MTDKKSILFTGLFGLILCFYHNAQALVENESAKYNECRIATEDSSEWIDIGHQYINQSLCLPAEWFDSFFATDRLQEEVRPGSYVRWTNDFVQTEGGQFEYVTKIRASLRLPKASKRLKLVFEGEQEDSIEEIVSVNEEEAKTDVGLLYELLKSARANLNLKLNLSPKLSLRYRYSYPFSETFLTRFTQEFFQSDDDYGSESRIDLEHRLAQGLLLRWTNISEDTHLITGTQWTSALVLYHRLTEISALSYEASVNGLTVPETYQTNQRVALRYRRNFYRKWLFYELVPEVTWPRVLITDQRKQVSLFTFRLEIKFDSM